MGLGYRADGAWRAGTRRWKLSEIYLSLYLGSLVWAFKMSQVGMQWTVICCFICVWVFGSLSGPSNTSYRPSPSMIDGERTINELKQKINVYLKCKNLGLSSALFSIKWIRSRQYLSFPPFDWIAEREKTDFHVEWNRREEETERMRAIECWIQQIRCPSSSPMEEFSPQFAVVCHQRFKMTSCAAHRSSRTETHVSNRAIAYFFLHSVLFLCRNALAAEPLRRGILQRSVHIICGVYHATAYYAKMLKLKQTFISSPAHSLCRLRVHCSGRKALNFRGFHDSSVYCPAKRRAARITWESLQTIS